MRSTVLAITDRLGWTDQAGRDIKTHAETDAVSLAQWAHAQSIDDLGRLMVRWIDGEDRVSMSHWGPADPETGPMLGQLRQMNLRGLVTFDSQAGARYRSLLRIPVIARATLDAFGSAEAVSQVEESCLQAGLVTANLPLMSRRSEGGPSPMDSYVRRVLGVDLPVSFFDTAVDSLMRRRRGRSSSSLSRLDIALPGLEPSEALAAELDEARYISIIDPVAGRNDVLWPAVLRGLDVELEQRMIGG